MRDFLQESLSFSSMPTTCLCNIDTLITNLNHNTSDRIPLIRVKFFYYITYFELHLGIKSDLENRLEIHSPRFWQFHFLSSRNSYRIEISTFFSKTKFHKILKKFNLLSKNMKYIFELHIFNISKCTHSLVKCLQLCMQSLKIESFINFRI